MNELLDCPFCEYQTLSPERLDEHMKIHKTELDRMEEENQRFKRDLSNEVVVE